MHLTYRIHAANLNLNDQNVHPDLVGRLLYFLVSYIILLVVSYLYHRKSVASQLAFPIYPLPNENPQLVIYYLVVLFLGVIGAYVTFGNYWAAADWILYAVANVLLALYVILYQLTSRFTLFLTSIAATLLAVDLQWLFIETADMTAGNDEIVVRNFIGAVGAWGLIYALLTLGQFVVHTIGVNKYFQSVGFFIAGILLVAGIAFWNKSKFSGWAQLIGFIAVGAFLLIFCALNTRRNSSLDLESLLS